MKKNENSKIDALLARQQYRFESVLGAFENSKSFDLLQSCFEDIYSNLSAANPFEQEKAVIRLAKIISESLRNRGIQEKEVLEIEQVLVKNWMEILEEGKVVNLRQILYKAMRDWKEKSLEAQKATSIKRKKNVIGCSRIVLAAGFIVFDAAKIVAVVPLPRILLTSLVGGAVLFMNGVEDLWVD